MLEISRKFILIIVVVILLALIIFLAWDAITSGEIIIPAQMVRILSDAEQLRDFILQYEFFAPAILFLLQLIQVIISPIPGNVTTVIGGSLFGIYYGLIINTLSIYLGSIIAFYLSRKFGKPLVRRLLGESIYQKYNNIFQEKYIVSLLMIFLFPFFPDDALCLLTGISSIPARIFFFLLIIGRFPSIFLGTLIGAGLLELSVREFIIIGILFLLILIISLVYREKMENWLFKKVIKKNKEH